jgi:hypothetical protein
MRRVLLLGRLLPRDLALADTNTVVSVIATLEPARAAWIGSSVCRRV